MKKIMFSIVAGIVMVAFASSASTKTNCSAGDCTCSKTATCCQGPVCTCKK